VANGRSKILSPARREQRPIEVAELTDGPTHPSILYITDDTAAAAAVESLRQSTLLALDIETTPKAQVPKEYQGWSRKQKALDPRTADIRLMQFYGGGPAIYVFDLFRMSQKVLWPLFRIPLLAHPAKFEGKFLRHNGIYPKDLRCTMQLAKTRNPREFSLAASARLYLNTELDKTYQASDWSGPLTEEQIRYAAMDAYITFHLYRILIASGPAEAKTYDHSPERQMLL
jgi:ribonuclease D